MEATDWRFTVQICLSSMLIVFYSITMYFMIKGRIYNMLSLVCLLLLVSNVLWLVCDSFDYWDQSLGRITPTNQIMSIQRSARESVAISRTIQWMLYLVGYWLFSFTYWKISLKMPILDAVVPLRKPKMKLAKIVNIAQICMSI